MKYFLLLLLSVGFLTVGCKEEPPKEEVVEEKIEKDEDMVGLSLSEAEKLAAKRGLLHRVTMLDGKPQAATRDLRENRVNFVVESGKVVGVSRG